MRALYFVFLVLLLTLYAVTHSQASQENYTPAQAQRIVELQTLLKQAESGDAKSQFKLGSAFESDPLLPLSNKEAYFWYTMALESINGDIDTLIDSADKGQYLQQQEVCRIMTDNPDVKTTDACKRYAEKDFPLAQQLMCAAYSQGSKTIERDFNQAAKWCGLAAFTRSQESQGYLGVLYAHGLGVEQSYQNAYFWFSKLGQEENFLPFFKALRDQVAQQLSRDEKKEIDENLNSFPPIPADARQHYGEKGVKCFSNTELQYHGPCAFVPIGAVSDSGLAANKIRVSRANLTLTAEEYDEVIKQIKDHKPDRNLVNAPSFPNITKITTKAENGDAEAQLTLAKLYAYGRVIPKDRARAAELLLKSANQGNAESQLQIAGFYNWGDIVPKSLEEGANWYLKSAKNGHPRAQSFIADRYFRGQGVKQDLAEAFKWYQQAAEGGDVDAQAKLGTMYYSGAGTAQNFEKAFFWLSIYKYTTRLRGAHIETPLVLMLDSELHLTSNQTSEIKKQVEAWRPEARLQNGAERPE